MCGIVAVVRRHTSAPAISRSAVAGLLTEGLDAFSAHRAGDDALCLDTLASDLAAAAERLRDANELLKGVKGLQLMLDSTSVRDLLRHSVAEWTDLVDAIEEHLEICVGTTPARTERIGCELVGMRDSLWAIGRDRLGTSRAVLALLDGALGGDRSDGAVEAMLSVQQILSALDRLEVRGRDSAGLHLLVSNPAFDPHDPAVAGMLAERGRDRAFGSGSAHIAGGALSIVHKTAAEIGELGDNTAVLRAAVTGDELLAAALSDGAPSTLVLGHTRWASVGIISEPNAHPLDSRVRGTRGTRGLDAPHQQSPADPTAAGTHGTSDNSLDTPYVVAAVNGDVDNYAELLAAEGVEAPPAVTTDSKVVPVLMSRRMAEGVDRVEAFRRTVAACEGSVAVAAVAADAPDRLLLALHGSGQGLYVGLTDDAFIIASEPYGVVEETASYLRMDGDTTADPDDPGSMSGQILEIDGGRAGSPDGLTRWSYDGARLPISETEVVTAEITTRDIDRGDYPHFLLKEIIEAPLSFRKTLRGRIIESADGPQLVLGTESMPSDVRSALRDSSIRRVVVIGQGTAAVAGASLAGGLRSLLAEAGLTAALDVQNIEATELSAFHLSADMSDTLLIAISQSGTTTDTNRTVDLVRARGASVVAIVNRRNSDLAERADGVLYTSDGRDVEMSVASTKAFYSQVAAGWLLAVCIADEVAAAADAAPADATTTDAAPADATGADAFLDADSRSRLLNSILAMPDVLEEVLGQRSEVARAAQRLAPSRRHWAVVGSGANRVAAAEIRIKLSELCYKSIPCDVTEDKKHIDLSAEPLVLVCAAGLPGSVADDTAKEVAIFRAHRGAPVVITDDDQHRFSAASAVLTVPAVDPRLVCLPVTMVGHLFGYEAALAIDRCAHPLRRARAAVDSVAGSADTTDEQVLRATAPELERSAGDFQDGLRRGDYNGHLEASTAVRITSVLRYALGQAPLDLYELELKRVGTPAVVIEDLLESLTAGIDELTRPIDAIRHQAKTVTVGISRSEEAFLQGKLAAATLTAGAPRERLTYASLRTLAHLDPAVAEVLGHTRYRLDGLSSSEPNVVGALRPTPGEPNAVGAPASTPGEPNAVGQAVQPTATVVSRGGVSVAIESRCADSPVLTGTKHQVALERRVLAARGRHDGRTLVFVPEVSAGVAVGITLLHVRFSECLPAKVAWRVLQGYRNRLSELSDAVTETEPEFDMALLGEIAPVELLTAPLGDLADHWRSA